MPEWLSLAESSMVGHGGRDILECLFLVHTRVMRNSNGDLVLLDYSRGMSDLPRSQDTKRKARERGASGLIFAGAVGH